MSGDILELQQLYLEDYIQVPQEDKYKQFWEKVQDGARNNKILYPKKSKVL